MHSRAERAEDDGSHHDSLLCHQLPVTPPLSETNLINTQPKEPVMAKRIAKPKAERGKTAKPKAKRASSASRPRMSNARPAAKLTKPVQADWRDQTLARMRALI